MVQRRKGAAKDAAARYGEFPGEVQRGRMVFVARVLVIAFGVIVLRLVQLHIAPGNKLGEEDRKHIGSTPLYEPRGDILDRNGLTLATDRKVPSLWVDPRGILDPDAVATIVAKHTGMPVNEVFEKLTQRDTQGEPRKFVWIKRWLTDISEEALHEMEEVSDGFVTVRYEPLRYYPQKDMASHIIGFVNRDSEAGEGAELYFDKYLRSTPGKYTARKDGHQRMLESLRVDYEEPQGGNHLILTIDGKVQHNLEDALDRRIVETNADHGMGIVMDPATGAILALACRPGYDPNQYDTTQPELRKNRAIVDVFEPGSAFKIITAAAALEHDLINPETKIDCENGGFNPYGHYIKDFHRLGVEPFRHCFYESSNVAIIKVGAMLGPERLDQWIRKFGIGKTTSREFRGESRGMYMPYNPDKNKSTWSKLTMGSLPMGQEVAVTMLQLARSFSVIANGGYLVEPHYVQRAVNRDGEVVYEYTPPSHERILSPSTCDTMKELCAGVVTDGTGEKAQILEYRVGGKTGTAQIARHRSEGGGYIPGAFNTVFAGFAPVTHPRLVSVIVVNQPMIKLHYGGYVCGPVFQEVVRNALIDMEVPQDPVLDKDGVPLIAKLKEKDIEKAPESGDERFIESVDAEVLATLDPATAATASASSLALVKKPAVPAKDKKSSAATEAMPPHVIVQAGQLPDFRGMTKREVQQVLLPLNIPWDTQGAGWVVEQEPPAGTAITDVERCRLRFGTREQAKAGNEPQTHM